MSASKKAIHYILITNLNLPKVLNMFYDNPYFICYEYMLYEYILVLTELMHIFEYNKCL